VDLRFLRAKESIRLSFLIDPRLGGRAFLRREEGREEGSASVCVVTNQRKGAHISHCCAHFGKFSGMTWDCALR
jgi:hypothetical protein